MTFFYDKGLKFSCTRCSRCCRVVPGFVYLSRSDLTNLCICFKLNDGNFIKKYCRWVPYYDHTEVLCLKEKENFDCILWNEGCTAYDHRPIQCSTYPFWTYLLESQFSWNERSHICPGINSGELHCKDEITHQLNLYERNVPLRRTDFKNEVIVEGEEK